MKNFTKTIWLTAILLFVLANAGWGQVYWNTNGTLAVWTSTNWGTSAGGPFTTVWTSNSDAIFSANSSVNFATTSIGNVTVSDGITVTVTNAGTLSMDNSVRTFNIGTGSTLTWTSQSVTANSTAGITKSGSGILNLGALTFTTNMTGGFTLNSGTVIVTGNKAFGNGALTINGGTIQSSNSSTFAPTTIIIGGNFIFTGTGNDIYGAPVTLGSSTRTITNNINNGAYSRQFAGIISGDADVGLTIAGTSSGPIILSGANTYTGLTTVSGSILQLNRTGGTTIPTTNNITVNGGILKISTNQTLNDLNLSSGTLTVEAGVTLAINGTFTYTGGTITNSGTIAYGSSGTLVYGTGSSYSAGLEWPSSNSPFNITIQTIGTNITMPGNRSIDGTLTLSSGLLTLGDYNLTLSSSSTISGTPTSSNMIVATGSGELRKTFTSTGSFTFPVGDNTGTADYSPVTLNFTSGTFASAYAGVKLSNTQHGNNNGSDYIKRYWTVTQSGISGFSCDAAFTYVDADIVGDENNLYCGAWNGSSWTLLNTVNTSTNTLSGTVTAFSEFTGGDQGVLPAELHSFTSSTSANSIQLIWSTVIEMNNSGFDIERKKTESNNWQKIGFVQGHGTTNTPQSYSYSDRYLSTGKYNYRLKQIDYNGNYQYYNLGSEVTIGVPKKFEVSQNFPNPFNPVTKINYELPNDSKVSIKVFDMLGREVATLLDEFKTAGYHTVDFDGSSLSSGMYFYRIKTNEFEAIKKMLLIK